MRVLYAMVLLRSVLSTVYEPSIKSIVMDRGAKGRKREQIGSFAGLQQTMKGASQVTQESPATVIVPPLCCDIPSAFWALCEGDGVLLG
jgi:hypothetical protein